MIKWKYPATGDYNNNVTDWWVRSALIATKRSFPPEMSAQTAAVTQKILTNFPEKARSTHLLLSMMHPKDTKA